MIVNANSMIQHVIQIKNWIMIKVNANVKSIARAKKLIAGIAVHVLVRIGGI